MAASKGRDKEEIDYKEVQVWRAMEMFYFGVYIVQTHNILHIKKMNFTLPKWYLNKSDIKYTYI